MDEKNNDQSFDNNDDNEIKHIDKEELEKIKECKSIYENNNLKL